MYKFKIRLLSNEEDFFCTKTGLLNFKLTLPIAKLGISKFKVQFFSDDTPVHIQLLLLLLMLLK